MKTETSTVEIRHLVADEGKTLTNGEVYTKDIYLGKLDGPENWREIDDADVPPEPTPEEIEAEEKARQEAIEAEAREIAEAEQK